MLRFINNNISRGSSILTFFRGMIIIEFKNGGKGCEWKKENDDFYHYRIHRDSIGDLYY